MAGPGDGGPDGAGVDGNGWTEEPDWAVAHLRSAGVDVGSATCHVVFSEITMAKQGQRFVPVRRQVTHTSPVLLTPYRDGTEIDAGTVVSFVDQQFIAAGIGRAGIDAGVVILTGTALDRANSRLVADLVADQTGVFVAVSAGDDMEAVLAAHGCGAVARSIGSSRAVLAVDIGGGTTKLALCENGGVTATAALDVGARLVAVDADGRVVRLEPAAERVAQRLGLRLAVGEGFTDADRDTLVGHLVEQVFIAAGLRGRRRDSWLLRTAPLSVGEPAGLTGSGEAVEVVVSGGVAEYLADPDAATVGDLGPSLGQALRAAFAADPRLRVTVPEGAIRATVFGAALFTVQLSGDTILVTDPALLPLRNVPVVNLPPLPADVDADAIARTMARNAAVPTSGTAPPAAVAVGVHWTGSAVRDRLDALARGIAGGLGGSDGSGPVVLVCDGDVGRLLGRRVAGLLGPQRPVVSVDGIDVRDLDYIDVGPPAGRSRAVPVTVKSLLFPDPGPLS